MQKADIAKIGSYRYMKPGLIYKHFVNQSRAFNDFQSFVVYDFMTYGQKLVYDFDCVGYVQTNINGRGGARTGDVPQDTSIFNTRYLQQEPELQLTIEKLSHLI